MTSMIYDGPCACGGEGCHRHITINTDGEVWIEDDGGMLLSAELPDGVLTKRIAELEAELAALRAERWEPVTPGNNGYIGHASADGAGTTHEWHMINGVLCVDAYRTGKTACMPLPPGTSLCRKEARNE